MNYCELRKWGRGKNRRGCRTVISIPATMAAPPIICLVLKTSPPQSQAASPAKTGSIVKITAVCAGEVNFWALVWIRKAREVAGMAVAASAQSTSGARRSGNVSTHGAAPRLNSPTTAICSTARV